MGVRSWINDLRKQMLSPNLAGILSAKCGLLEAAEQVVIYGKLLGATLFLRKFAQLCRPSSGLVIGDVENQFIEYENGGLAFTKDDIDDPLAPRKLTNPKRAHTPASPCSSSDQTSVSDNNLPSHTSKKPKTEHGPSSSS